MPQAAKRTLSCQAAHNATTGTPLQPVLAWTTSHGTSVRAAIPVGTVRTNVPVSTVRTNVPVGTVPTTLPAGTVPSTGEGAANLLSRVAIALQWLSRSGTGRTTAPRILLRGQQAVADRATVRIPCGWGTPKTAERPPRRVGGRRAGDCLEACASREDEMKRSFANLALTLTMAAGALWLGPTSDPAASSSQHDVPFPPVADATYESRGNVTTIVVPTGPCASVTASPIQVGDFVVWPMHDRARDCTSASPYRDALLGYNIRDGILYLLGRTGSSEATPLYEPDIGRVFQNLVFGGSVAALDASTFQKIAALPSNFRVTSDSSGVYVNGLYYFGTINTPEPFCQQPVNRNCGAVFAMDESGNLVNSLDLEDGFRSWVGAGLTSNGQFLYVGGAEQFLGASSAEFYYGCSVVKLDPQLNILVHFDPGDEGCHRTGVGQNDEDAVAGEVVIAADGTLWVVFTHAVDPRNMFAMYHLSADLEPICAFELQGGPLMMAGYYQSPTIDRDGNAYVHVSPAGAGQRGEGQLWKVTPACQGTQLATLPQGGTSTPVLADDRYVLTIAAGQLQVRDLHGNAVSNYGLASAAQVIGSPMLADGVIYVVDATGALTVIRNTGLAGYGTAAWPRYRHDNRGSGRQAMSVEIFLPFAWQVSVPAVLSGSAPGARLDPLRRALLVSRHPSWP